MSNNEQPLDEQRRLTARDLEEIKCIAEQIAVTSAYSGKMLNDVTLRVANLLLDTEEYRAYKAAATLEQAQEWAKSRAGCDVCEYKVNSEAWMYYTYPCNECKRRTKDHFTEAAMREGTT